MKRTLTIIGLAVAGIVLAVALSVGAFALVGDPLSEPDIRERRPVGILGYDVADKLFDRPASAVGQRVRITGRELKSFIWSRRCRRFWIEIRIETG